MRRFKLVIEYDGRPFLGWQSQASVSDGRTTVQDVMEAAIAKFDPRGSNDPKILVYASGRTDAGVHASGQVAHVDIQRDIEAFPLQGALNFHLQPWPVSVLHVEEVTPDFHARYNAKERHYRYRILNRVSPPALEQGLVWHVMSPLDEEKMRDAADYLVGHHDFTTFRHVGCQSKSPLKTLNYIRIERSGEYVDFYVGARSFLHHQVRSMVGCLKLVGQGKWAAEDIRKALEARDRQALGLNAPPDGLYFTRVDY